MIERRGRNGKRGDRPSGSAGDSAPSVRFNLQALYFVARQACCKGIFQNRFVCLSGQFLGVSLSAAALRAAALVYDKLTSNCQSVINFIEDTYSY